VDGTARLLHVVNKRILATLVHAEAPATDARAMDAGDGDAQTESNYSVETVGFSKVFTWCATGESIPLADSCWCTTGRVTDMGSVAGRGSAGGMDGTLKIWDLSNYSCRHVCQHDGGVVKLQWHDTLPLVYTACTDGVVRLWEARSGAVIYSLTGHEVRRPGIGEAPAAPVLMGGLLWLSIYGCRI
jgi:angio-associated migratory cell protein